MTGLWDDRLGCFVEVIEILEEVDVWDPTPEEIAHYRYASTILARLSSRDGRAVQERRSMAERVAKRLPRQAATKK